MQSSKRDDYYFFERRNKILMEKKEEKNFSALSPKAFRTRQEIRAPMTNPKGRDFIIGLDVGYSATKVFFETGCLCFPSYAKRIDAGSLTRTDEKDILYRDEETGDVYIVGYNAQDMIDITDTNDTDGELFSRKRYSDARFKIVCKTALALATRGKTDNRKIVIQTGLPAHYVKTDSNMLKQSLCEDGPFSLKVGNGKWEHFDIKIDKDDIFVMAQPAGALYSAIIKKDGHFSDMAKDILSDSVIVLDIGFGTFDFYGIRNRAVDIVETINDIGMHQVMAETSKLIFDEYGEEVRVAAIQQDLETGIVECFNEEEMRSESKQIAPLLEKANKTIMKDAMNRAKSVAKSFRGYHYAIVDGGTGEAWLNDIREWLSGLKTLKVMPSNINDGLPLIYSNSRGYYMYRYQQNKRRR